MASIISPFSPTTLLTSTFKQGTKTNLNSNICQFPTIPICRGGTLWGQGRVPAPPKFAEPSVNIIGFRGNLVEVTNKSSIRPPQNQFGPPKKSGQVPPLPICKNTKKQELRLLLVVKASGAEGIPTAVVSSNVRFRLDNLGPQPGSRKNRKRKGRGHAAGQGGSCGFGMRGQKSRSGPGVRPGFEGGQMPLYRRLPKLRGIAGGMHAGLSKYVPVNLKDIATAGFEEGEEVSLESLKEKGLINPSGRERRLPLKILGDGELSVKLNFKARAFSAQAKEKLEAAGCSLTVLPGRKKWVKPSVAKNQARADEYFAKKRAAAAANESPETASTA